MKTLNVFLLEDYEPHVAGIQDMLGRLLEDQPDYCKIKIVLVKDTFPSPRNPEFTEAFTAPLSLPPGQYRLRSGSRDKEGNWTFNEEIPNSLLEIVPWVPSNGSNYFMPHLVILDIYTPGGTHSDTHATPNNYNHTVALFRGCGYPSDLVWTLSQKAGVNTEYGHFFPKPFLTDLNSYQDALLHTLKALLAKHIGMPALHSYIERDAAKFYEDILDKNPWKSEIRIEVHTSGVNHANLTELWSNGNPASKYVWRIVDKPIVEDWSDAKGVFFFFRRNIGRRDQAGYVTGQWFGLPVDWLWHEENEDIIYKYPEEVLQESVFSLKRPSVNSVLKRNIFVLVKMIIEHQRMFDYLNHALPGLALSAGQVDNMHIFGKIVGAGPSARKQFWSPDEGFNRFFLQGLNDSTQQHVF